ncbi:hypothetical protein FACS189443_0380 [Planctomycetales bacterium]|nr:hypothetical protein FACS189443_0380 [Planctomycetales bacterium]
MKPDEFDRGFVDENVLSRGRDWLIRYQQKQAELLKNASLSDDEKKNKHWKPQADELDAFVLMVLGETFAELLKPADVKEAPNPMLDEYLKRDIGKLSPYGVSMYGIAATLYRRPDVSQTCVKILEQYLVQDDENQTAYLNLNNYSGWRWWCWYGSEYETQAYYLKLLMRTNPKSPAAPRLVKYLLNNRKHATYWNSTRDTAICIEAFAEYLQATQEAKTNVDVEVLYDGKSVKTAHFTPENLLTLDNTFSVQGEAVTGGKHKIEVRKNGNSPLYITASLENFTLEDPITKAGLEVKIERRIYKLVQDTGAKTQVAGDRGQVVGIKTEKYTRQPIGLNADAEIKSGDLIEIELIIESKNDYECLLIEDRKAAGCELVEVRSGYPRYDASTQGSTLFPYVEYRDERVAFFVERLPRGKHNLTYRLRAETPGKFSALTAKIEAMYAPDLKGNSDENKIKIDE